MRPTLQITLALAALLAPPGPGLLAVPAALALGGGPLVCAALLCCALAPAVAPLRRAFRAAAVPPPHAPARAAPPGVAAGDTALLLHGRWREPPGERPFLATDGGPVALGFAEGVLPPPPGTPCRVRARCDARGRLLAVHVTATGPPAGAWLDRWSAAAQARVAHLVEPDRRGLVAALILGVRDGLSFPVQADCARTGVSHLLALSGLNVTLLAATWTRFGPDRSLLATALLLLGFVAVAGAGAPLVRAALGWGLLVAGRLQARRSPALVRLAAVALVMEAWSPGLHHELSAQLSFLAVGGLIAAAGLARPPYAALLAPCGAFLATAPLCAETFGRVAPFGVLATPLLVPAVTVILAVGVVAVLPGALFAALDPLAGPVLDGSARVMQALLAWLAAVGPAPLRPPPPPLPGWLLSLLVVASLAVLARLRRTPSALEDLAT